MSRSAARVPVKRFAIPDDFERAPSVGALFPAAAAAASRRPSLSLLIRLRVVGSNRSEYPSARLPITLAAAWCTDSPSAAR
ncbi:MAG: hypothetical protein ACYCUD_09940, partial [Candidatus Dormibacteria bacterium]